MLKASSSGKRLSNFREREDVDIQTNCKQILIYPFNKHPKNIAILCTTFRLGHTLYTLDKTSV